MLEDFLTDELTLAIAVGGEPDPLDLLRPEGLYGTRPAKGGNKAAKLKAIREALRKDR
jgi:hypothetical protein